MSGFRWICYGCSVNDLNWNARLKSAFYVYVYVSVVLVSVIINNICGGDLVRVSCFGTLNEKS